MLKNFKSAAINATKKKPIPAEIIDVLGNKCSVRLSLGNGISLKNLYFSGSVPSIGDKVQVDYSGGDPIVLVSDKNDRSPTVTTYSSKPDISASVSVQRVSTEAKDNQRIGNLVYRGEWDGETDYFSNDVVTVSDLYQTIFYLASIDNIGVEPGDIYDTWIVWGVNDNDPGGSLPTFDPDRIPITNSSTGELETSDEVVYDNASQALVLGRAITGWLSAALGSGIKNILTQVAADTVSLINAMFVYSDTLTHGAGIRFYRALGTKASPLAVLASTVIGFIRASGLHTDGGTLSDYSGTVAETSYEADGDFSSSSQPTRIVESTTKTGEITRRPVRTIDNAGQLILHEYGAGLFAGTATKTLAVDASGNVIETGVPSGGGSLLSLDKVSSAPAYEADKALMYFLDTGDLMARMKIGALEREFVIATMKTTITLPTYIGASMISNQATTNANLATLLVNTGWIGERNDATQIRRVLLKYAALSDGTIPSTSTILSAKLFLYVNADYSSNARTLDVFRVLRAYNPAQTTWNVYTTGNAWTTAGCGSAGNDYDNTVVGSRAFSASETLNEYKEIDLDPALIQDFVDGSWTDNGFILRFQTETNDAYRFNLSVANETNLPYIEVVYL